MQRLKPNKNASLMTSICDNNNNDELYHVTNENKTKIIKITEIKNRRKHVLWHVKSVCECVGFNVPLDTS